MFLFCFRVKVWTSAKKPKTNDQKMAISEYVRLTFHQENVLSFSEPSSEVILRSFQTLSSFRIIYASVLFYCSRVLVHSFIIILTQLGSQSSGSFPGSSFSLSAVKTRRKQPSVNQEGVSHQQLNDMIFCYGV